MAGNPTLQTHLCNATPPWSALLVVPRGTSASALVKTPPGFAVRTIQGKQCRTPAGLFGEFARALAFPDYFGHNWDALEECLNDLSWLGKQSGIVLVHKYMPLANERQRSIYIDILRHAQANQRLLLRVVFPRSARLQVEKIDADTGR